MDLLMTPYKCGDVRGAIYTFEKVGDMIQMHKHNKNNIHITIVARGKIEHRIDGQKPTVHECGNMLEFPDNVIHEIRALEDNTRTYNIIKYGYGFCENDEDQNLIDNNIEII